MYVMPQGVLYSSHSAVETNSFDLEWGGGGGVNLILVMNEVK